MCEQMEVEEYYVYRQENLHEASFAAFETIRHEGKLCDVVLRVDDEVFRAHRLVLAATIPYFHAMFTIDMVERNQEEIVIKGIEPFALEALINFAYTGCIKLSPSNVESILIGACYFDLVKVRDACSDFLEKRLDPTNCFSMRSLAERLGSDALIEKTNRYIQKNFTQLASSDGLLTLSFDELTDIIRTDDLYVDSEETVFEAVVKWVDANPDERNQHLSELLVCVRLPLLSPQYLSDSVKKYPQIRTDIHCRDLLDEAKDYHLMPERRAQLQTFRTRPRCCTDTVGVIYAVGGLTSSGDSVSTVEYYDPLDCNWHISSAMKTMRSRVGVAVLNGELYAIGGFDGRERLKTVEVYNTSTRKWQQAASMIWQRSALGAAVVGESMFVCGGYDGVASLNTVEHYSLENNRFTLNPLVGWSVVATMNRHRSAGGVALLQRQVYALGGHDGLSIFDSTEVYDPGVDKWVLGPKMLSKRCRLGVASLNGRLYACGGYDGTAFLNTVEAFDPSSGKWGSITPMKTKRSRVALVANCGKLFAIGGYDGQHNLNTIEVYDPIADSWVTNVKPMCAHEGGVGVAVIPNEPYVQRHMLTATASSSISSSSSQRNNGTGLGQISASLTPTRIDES